MFKIIWDKSYNGVRLTMSAAEEALNVAPRPVFWEELDLLGLNKKGWGYPHCKEPLLWACNRRYFYCGQLVMEVNGGNLFDAPTVNVTPEGENLHLKPVDMEQLRKRNENSMFLIEHEAMSFISEQYRRYKGIKAVSEKNPDIDFQQLAERTTQMTKEEHVVVKEDCDSFDIMPLSEAEAAGKAPILNSKVEMFVATFSGGKDSQVVLDLMARVVPSKDFIVIYSDTGYELPTSLELYKEVEAYYHQKYPELKFYTARNHQSVQFYWDEMGAPSRMHRWCCSIMKSVPLSRLLASISGEEKQPSTLLFEGVRAEESVTRANRSRIGRNVKHNNVVNASPILEWNSVEVYLYILFHDLPFNQAYRQGLARVGCVICPYSSSWSEDLCGILYPGVVEPFVGKLRNTLKRAKVSGIDNYIKTGMWKTRAGGRDVQTTSHISIISQSPVFKAKITNPRENIFEWIKILGKPQFTTEGNTTICVLKTRQQIYTIKWELSDKNILSIEAPDIDKDISFMSSFKRVLNKVTYCVHCEACEVECPTGALSVLPITKIDEEKCIGCLKCIYKNKHSHKGCIVAESVITSTGESMTTTKSSINHYNDGMGLRNLWLQKYFDNPEGFFQSSDHGLNEKYQVPPFTNWIREAEILQKDKKEISEKGKLLADAYADKPDVVWEIIFINLCYNSEICKWYHSHIDISRLYSREEMDIILQEAYPDFKDRTLTNPFNSLINTFKESPLSSSIPVGSIEKKQGKLTLIRIPYNELSLAATAYSLYKMAESQNRHAFTVNELYEQGQTEGLYRQFGTDRTVVEGLLRSLMEEEHHVLTADLNMGLNNINLRKDLTSTDILRMLL